MITCSLVASRIVSMTFIPLLGYYLLRPKIEPSIEERRKTGFAAFYYRVGGFGIRNRWKVLLASVMFLAFGAFAMSRLKQQFFPKDLSYLSTSMSGCPKMRRLRPRNEAARRAEMVIRQVAEKYGSEHPEKDGKPREVLNSMTTFVGGGGPRFWFSVSPELQQLNYAQVIIQVKDKHDTNHLIGLLQKALDSKVPGARIDVRQLETGKPVGLPVEIRISGDDMDVLRTEAERVKTVLRATPYAQRVRDDWGEENFTSSSRPTPTARTRGHHQPGRGRLLGDGNQRLAGRRRCAKATSRSQSSTRLRMEERAQIVRHAEPLRLLDAADAQKMPLRQVSSVEYRMQTEKIRRRNQFRTITVCVLSEAGALPSEVLGIGRCRVCGRYKRASSARLQDGNRGRVEEQQKGLRGTGGRAGNLLIAMIYWRW